MPVNLSLIHILDVQLTQKGNECLEQLAGLHRRELLSLQGKFTVPDLTTLGHE